MARNLDNFRTEKQVWVAPSAEMKKLAKGLDQLESVRTAQKFEQQTYQYEILQRTELVGELRNLALLGTNLLILGLQHLPEKIDSVVLRCGHGNRLVDWLLTGSRLKRRLTKLLLVLRLLCKLLLW